MTYQEKIDLEGMLDFADGFQCKTEARAFLESRFHQLQELPTSVRLYRVLFLENHSDINTSDLGRHWIQNEDDLSEELLEYLQEECFGEHLPGFPVFVSTCFKKSDVDIEMTLRQNILNPHEREIFIRQGAIPTSQIMIKSEREGRYRTLPLMTIGTELSF